VLTGETAPVVNKDEFSCWLKFPVSIVRLYIPPRPLLPVGVTIELLVMLGGRLFVLREAICGRLRITFLFYELFFALTAQIINVYKKGSVRFIKRVLLAYLASDFKSSLWARRKMSKP
jgi:hypothetical protein